jgi:hypothetical protein
VDNPDYAAQASKVVADFCAQAAAAGPSDMIALLRAKAEVHQAVVDGCIRVADSLEAELGRGKTSHV